MVKPRRDVVTRKILVGWGVVVLFILAIIVIYSQAIEPTSAVTYTILWAEISLICLFFVMRYSFSVRLEGAPNILEIPVYISFTSLVLIALAGLAPYFDKKYLASTLSSVTLLPKGFLLTGVGLVCMWLGYAVVVSTWYAKPQKRTLGQQRLHLDFSNPSFDRTLVIYSGLFVIRLMLILNGGGEKGGRVLKFGLFDMWLTYLLTLHWVLIGLFILQGASRRWPRLPLLFVLPAEVFIVLLTGYSSSALKLLFFVMGCFSFQGQRLSWRKIIVAVIFLTFFVPAVRSIRTTQEWTSAAGSINQNSYISSAFAGVERSFLTNRQEAIGSSRDLFLKRQSEIAQTPAIILERTPSRVAYRPFDELVTLPFWILPRVVWSSKPDWGTIGATITKQYFDVPSSYGASAVTLAGSVYIYGGWGFVMVSMFILGIFSAQLYVVTAIPAHLNNQIGLYALYASSVIFNLHIGENSVPDLWQGFVQFVLINLVLLFFLCVTKGDNPEAFENHPLTDVSPSQDSCL